MLEGFTREMKFKKGGHYDADTLWMAGYLYKYWTSTRHADTREIYKIAPIRKLAIRYNFYHTQGFEYIIEDLIDRQDCPLMNDKELEKILKTEEAI
jgi:hypothetical protein